jgi:hypothetical protein
MMICSQIARISVSFLGSFAINIFCHSLCELRCLKRSFFAKSYILRYFSLSADEILKNDVFSHKLNLRVLAISGKNCFITLSQEIGKNLQRTQEKNSFGKGLRTQMCRTVENLQSGMYIHMHACRFCITQTEHCSGVDLV